MACIAIMAGAWSRDVHILGVNLSMQTTTNVVIMPTDSMLHTHAHQEKLSLTIVSDIDSIVVWKVTALVKSFTAM